MAISLLKGAAFVTGAASGIGKATAFAFAQYGIQRIAISDRSAPDLRATALKLQAQFPFVEIKQLIIDVTKDDEIDRGVADAVAAFGRIDIAVNNAGVSGAGKATHEAPSSDWQNVVDVNLSGVWKCQRRMLQQMLTQEKLSVREGRGTIINVASMYGLVGPPAHITAAAYTASKHGVLGLTKADGITYAPKGIRINAICPGYVDTPLLRADSLTDYMKKELLKVPLGRLSSQEEMADSIAFLASPMASFIVGAALVADGGYSIQ
ncbi:hypothetical protein V496_02804 [Pseudogymnoascus sp. VKM F-4515 (FW-2607)]|nr:hypothetical protein V496_02804 [Pseudogymnoascus sp. VKM F-4515 (FW-2607)]KFZ00458.1 hypothetical protein V498_00082 [Pseudogymnoascus sp. VKM F-4517 (FW-2822)]